MRTLTDASRSCSFRAPLRQARTHRNHCSRGDLLLPDTLTLGPEDSDTIWEAPHGEHPVISGGRVISGWTKSAGAAWKADAPGPYFHQLFVVGPRATRARIPNNGFFRIDGAAFISPFSYAIAAKTSRRNGLGKATWKSSLT